MDEPAKCAAMGTIARQIAEEQFDRPHSYMAIVNMADQLLQAVR